MTALIDVRLAAADVLARAAELVARRGHYPLWAEPFDPTVQDMADALTHFHSCPLSGLAALHLAARSDHPRIILRTRAPHTQPRETPPAVTRAVDAWAVHLMRFYGAAPVFNGDRYLDALGTVTAWEATATGQDVAETLRAAAYPLRAEGSRKADVTARPVLEGALT